MTCDLHAGEDRKQQGNTALTENEHLYERAVRNTIRPKAACRGSCEEQVGEKTKGLLRSSRELELCPDSGFQLCMRGRGLVNDGRSTS